ncbi:MAG: hypothetical protein EAZ60_27530 [Oscillatoriales cyanobacterium]|nr:MAG: hypothetical protein EAZ83_27645 [Oscillatoriales cyanobacterium]TAF14824.1 MAG: hypothetical protein EAZ73_28035 [Oscillatoriales cyanobacterium]TAF29252.1 MAG: hypothetical protein EAZ69_25210 [Oscillatoriales cyanobacterium]TAF50913.1 MAG: hypothetical protein EAZ60_27530 [Oscillatoriales cyanobacterium]
MTISKNLHKILRAIANKQRVAIIAGASGFCICSAVGSSRAIRLALGDGTKRKNAFCQKNAFCKTQMLPMAVSLWMRIK